MPWFFLYFNNLLVATWVKNNKKFFCYARILFENIINSFNPDAISLFIIKSGIGDSNYYFKKHLFLNPFHSLSVAIEHEVVEAAHMICDHIIKHTSYAETSEKDKQYLKNSLNFSLSHKNPQYELIEKLCQLLSDDFPQKVLDESLILIMGKYQSHYITDHKKQTLLRIRHLLVAAGANPNCKDSNADISD